VIDQNPIAQHRRRGNTRKHEKGTRTKRETRQKKIGAPVARDSAGRWLSSGNLNGRPTVALEIREMAREHGPEAIERLVHWMRSGDAQNSIAAAKILLDRGYGKSMTLVGTPNGAPLVNITMGAPITDAAEAARVYAELMHNPSADLSAITFASRAPSTVVAEVPPAEMVPAAAEMAAVSTIVAADRVTSALPPPQLPDRLAARIGPVETDAAETWRRLAK